LVPLLVLIIGTFVSVLDVSIVNVAIPDIQKDFGTSTEDIQWVSTAYSLTLGVLVPATGWLGDRFGMRRIYWVSLIGFAVTSGLCGLAWDLPSIVVFRILQAVPGGILPVVTMTMVYKIVPSREIGTAMGIYGLGVVFAPAAGPTLGGYLVEYIDWRLIFFINVPVGLLGAVAAFMVLDEFPRPSLGRFDLWGFGTAAAGLFALLLAFTKGPDWGWDSYRVLTLIVGGVLSLALFVVVELGTDDPLLDVRLFAIWPFSNSLILLTALFVGLFAVLFYIPLFLQSGQGIRPLHAGLILLPEAIVMGIFTPISGLLYDLIGPRWPSVLGLGLAAYGTYLLAGITADVPESQIILWTCIRAAGNGLAMMCIMTAGLAAVPARAVNGAGAINNVAQRVASALGLALLVAMETASQAQLTADRSALIPPNALSPAPVDPVGAGAQQIQNLYPVWGRLQLEVTAASFGNVFLVTAVVTAVGAVAALLLRVKPAGRVGPAEPAAPAGEHPPAGEGSGATAEGSGATAEGRAAADRDGDLEDRSGALVR
jgi:EmrB/QacA subfamily drug resistance transporter